MNPVSAQAGLVRALALAHAQTAAKAPQDETRVFAERSATWTALGREMLACGLPDVTPDESTERTRELAEQFESVGETWRISEPAGIYSITFAGELISMPPDFGLRVGAAKRVELIFEHALGGDARVADRMIALLKAASIPVVGRVRDFAASAHTDILVLGCTRRLLAPSARLMLHSSRAVVFGTSDEMARVGESIRRLDVERALDYVERTGQPAEIVAHWFSGETFWFTADQAVCNGLADALSPQGPSAPIGIDPRRCAARSGGDT